jgi:hypothetical protein
MEKREDWLKRQISTIEADLRELREGAYNPRAVPARARNLSILLNRHRRELDAVRQITIEYRPVKIAESKASKPQGLKKRL